MRRLDDFVVLDEAGYQKHWRASAEAALALARPHRGWTVHQLVECASLGWGYYEREQVRRAEDAIDVSELEFIMPSTTGARS
jgi:hypothetical protein